MVASPECFSWDLRALGQISDQNLIASEQLGLGGYTTARGYEEREANVDQGWFISSGAGVPGALMHREGFSAISVSV